MSKYTTEAFAKAIGRTLMPHTTGTLKALFDKKCTVATDALALGLGLEWLRGQGMHSQEYRKVAQWFDGRHDYVGMGNFQWLCSICPRPGQALAKAIIDATKG